MPLKNTRTVRSRYSYVFLVAPDRDGSGVLTIFAEPKHIYMEENTKKRIRESLAKLSRCLDYENERREVRQAYLFRDVRKKVLS